tara:strand:- start:76 stop:603 length:528 start_codon:yes stop_codon:yes gene_type:complete
MATKRETTSEDWTESPLTSYGSAKEAAQVYGALAGLLPGSVKAQDYEKLRLAGCQASVRPGLPPSQIRALDVRRDLERVWGQTLTELRQREGTQRGAELWMLWWRVRVRLVPMREAAADCSGSTVHRRVAQVDAVVLDILDELELRRTTMSEEMESRVNEHPERSQLWVAPMEEG